MPQSPEILALRSRLHVLLTKREMEAARHTLLEARSLAAQNKTADDRGTVYEMEAAIERTVFNYAAALALVDKAITLFKKVKNQPAYIQALLSKATIYGVKGEYRTSIALCSKALSHTKLHPVSSEVNAEINKMLGLCLTYTGRFAEAIFHTETAIKLFAELKNNRHLAGSYQNLAIAQRYMGDFQRATESALEAIRLFEQQQLFLLAGSALDLLGVITNENGNPAKALEYLRKAKEIRLKHNDQKGLFYSCINIGSALFKMQQYEESLLEARNAMQLVVHQSHSAEMCRVHICMATVYVETEEWEDALEHCTKAQQLAYQNHDARTEAEVMSIRGKLCFRTHQYKEAKDLLEKSIAIGREKELWPHVQSCEELLYEIAEAENDASAALYHYRQVTALRQQQLDAQIQQRMLLLQMQFDTKKKDEEIDRLKKQYDSLESRKNEKIMAYKLTPREQTILGLLVQGLSYKEIAAELGIAYETTREHISNFYKKLNVGTNTEAVTKAIKEGLV